MAFEIGIFEVPKIPLPLLINTNTLDTLVVQGLNRLQTSTLINNSVVFNTTVTTKVTLDSQKVTNTTEFHTNEIRHVSKVYPNHILGQSIIRDIDLEVISKPLEVSLLINNSIVNNTEVVSINKLLPQIENQSIILDPTIDTLDRLYPYSLSSTTVIHQALLSGVDVLQVDLLVNTNSINQVSLDFTYDIEPERLINREVIPKPVIFNLLQFIEPERIENYQEVFVNDINALSYIEPDRIENLSTINSCSLNMYNEINVQGISNSSNFFMNSVMSSIEVVVDILENASSFEDHEVQNLLKFIYPNTLINESEFFNKGLIDVFYTEAIIKQAYLSSVIITQQSNYEVEK